MAACPDSAFLCLPADWVVLKQSQQNTPLGHWVQVVAVASLLKKPGGQGKQDSACCTPSASVPLPDGRMDPSGHTCCTSVQKQVDCKGWIKLLAACGRLAYSMSTLCGPPSDCIYVQTTAVWVSAKHTSIGILASLHSCGQPTKCTQPRWHHRPVPAGQ
jgi:hypothetical protein